MELSQEEIKMVLGHRERKAFNDAYNQGVTDCVKLLIAHRDTAKPEIREVLREIGETMNSFIRCR